MGSRASALAVLGLEPGADGAAIEQAYRRLIKQYHPDREGGDGGRAAEITKAYRELRGGKALTDPFQFNDHSRARRVPAWTLATVFLILGFAGGLILSRPIDPILDRLSLEPASHLIEKGAAAAPPDAMERPLNLSVIDAAARQALRISRSQDEMALSAASQDCHQVLRTKPTLRELDRCVAFDDAVITLQDRDPLRDEGPFAPLAVTGRQWSAASALSDDDLAIDSRLDRIRLRVELVLAPMIPPIVSATGN
jgi:hypothetical protein